MWVISRGWIVAGCLALTACSPALNWREVRLEPSALVAMLPCKPDQGTRSVTLAGQNLSMHMMGCEADSATFAVSYADLPDATQAAAVQAQWQTAMLGNMRATQNLQSPLNSKGVVGATGAVQLQAQFGVLRSFMPSCTLLSSTRKQLMRFLPDFAFNDA